jgi:Cu(I)-responsive transcriptional regulator
MHGPGDILLNIGEAARASGLSARMIRHYEGIGLLPPPTRNASGYRRFTARDLAALRFIRQAGRLGFQLPQVAELMGLWRDSGRTSREVKALAERQLDDLRARLRDLVAMEWALQELVAACRGDDAPHCTILDRLAGDVADPLRKEPARRMQPLAPHAKAASPPGPAASRATAPAAPAGEDLASALMAWNRPPRRGPA